MAFFVACNFKIEEENIIPQYAIMRFSKQKGGAGALEAHHERTKEKYASNPDIDSNRKQYNFHIIQPEQSYRRESDSRITAAGCKTRKDSVRFIDTLITASPEFFKGKKLSEVKEFFQSAVQFLSQKIGVNNIFTAVVHMDERTPHLHLCFTPITHDGRLSAKEIIGNRTQLTKWQDDFFKHMVVKFPDLERGESASKTGRRHIPTRVFKQAVNLTKQAEKIQTKLDSISLLNVSKGKEELAALLRKFFPQMEKFEGQMRKFKREISSLEHENAVLSERVKNAEKTKLRKQLEDGNLRKDYTELQRFIAALPDDVVLQAKRDLAQQKSQNRDRGGR